MFTLFRGTDLEQLLDYSRISNQISRSRSERRGSIVRPGSGMRKGSLASTSSSAGSDASVQLDELVEEVVESVLAGWSYRNRDDASFAAWNTQREGDSSRKASLVKTKPSATPTRPRPADVILDIEPGNWSFCTHPGAFRRIVMNLFGNSLKFTDAGFIRIRLFQTPDPGDPLCRTVVLVVSDSGKGIGKEYLEHDLFSPFSQEDPFAPGTGLGLSLVRQMAMTLGGSIDIKSEVGQGTTVKVSLPLPTSKEPPNAAGGDTGFRENIKALEGASVLLRGFRTDSQTQNGLADEEPRQRSQLQLMEDMCRDWLGVAVVKDGGGGVGGLTPSDFVIWSHTPEEGDDGEAVREAHEGLNSPHIVIRQETTAGPTMANCCHRGKAWFIGQPWVSFPGREGGCADIVV